ncbi:hypothetical protein AC578_4760 [Pseudocercospora eumusae]|uniref:Uncharacterized protein n=1 Tax=Pseudocercospora eumusae TaxID=321146 RepID=A0A139HLD2_9PEZI|nr:hypothetical protein AC578_4760 [Pseudocercospora eumusae]
MQRRLRTPLELLENGPNESWIGVKTSVPTAAPAFPTVAANTKKCHRVEVGNDSAPQTNVATPGPISPKALKKPCRTTNSGNTDWIGPSATPRMKPRTVQQAKLSVIVCLRPIHQETSNSASGTPSDLADNEAEEQHAKNPGARSQQRVQARTLNLFMRGLTRRSDTNSIIRC